MNSVKYSGRKLKHNGTQNVASQLTFEERAQQSVRQKSTTLATSKQKSQTILQLVM